MHFKIVGADAESGDDVAVMVDAPSKAEVEKIAHDKHILVSSITVEADAPAHAPHPPHAPHAPAAAPRPPAHKPKEDLAAISLIEDEPADGSPRQAGIVTVNASNPADTAHSGAGGIAQEKHNDVGLEYHIMLNQSLYLLESAVNKHIRDGWEPQGGVAVGVSNNAMQYFQALIRRKKT